MPGLADRRQQQALAAKVREMNSALSLFRPLWHAEPLHSQEALMRCLEPRQHLIIGSNRAGKSVGLAAKISAMALDKPIITRMGERIPQLRKDQQGRPRLMWLVGYDLKHVGQVVYPMLRKPGQFKVIRDEETGLLRAFNPYSERDWERNDKGECELAPPLIPDHEVADEVWYSRAGNELKSLVLKNGTEIRAYSSTQKAAAGVKVDAIWINERMEDDAHYEEFLFRLLDLRGRIFWDVYSEKNANDIVLTLWEKHLEQQARFETTGEPPNIAAFQFLAKDNPYLPKKSRQEILESGVLSEEALLTRDQGQLLISHKRFYPSFSRRVHSLLPADPDADDKLARAIRKAESIPLHWTRYLGLDPGTVKPFVIFVACPPREEFGEDFIVVYDEIATPRLDAAKLAAAIKAKAVNQTFEAFVIDGHAGRQSPMSFDRSVMTNYEIAFRSYGLKSVKTNHSFICGIDKPLIRGGMMDAVLSVRASGTPKLRIWLSRCPALAAQIESRRRKTGTHGELLDEPDPHQVHDGTDALEYVISRNPVYVDRGMSPSGSGSPWEEVVKLFGARGRRQREVVNCGPRE
jgi:hypothetical protein